MAFKYDKQRTEELFRGWFKVSGKDRRAPYDVEQITQLTDLIESELSEVLLSYIDNPEKTFLGKLPILYLRQGTPAVQGSSFLCFEDNTIISTSTSGCLASGKSRKEAFKNYIIAISECLNYRQLHDYSSKDGWFYLSIKDRKRNNCTVEEVAGMLHDRGWKKAYQCHYNSIYVKKDFPSTITVPNQGIIPPSLALWIEKMNYPVNQRQYYQTYAEPGLIKNKFYFGMDEF